MLPKAERYLLKKIARDSISHGLRHGEALLVDLSTLPAIVRETGASFVTLYHLGALRGCIGSLEAYRALADDVAANAFSAAFRDHRFPPVDSTIMTDLDIHISVLSPAEPIVCSSEPELLQSLRPGIDGLILEEGVQRATFLPAVWNSLPNPEHFVHELKRKAGLPLDYWSDTMSCYRYQTESF